MKKVTVKNFIPDFIILTVAQTFSISRHGLAFSTKTKSRFPFRKSRLLRLYSHCYLLLVQSLMVRSSHPEVFYRKGVLRNFAKFTGKHLS